MINLENGTRVSAVYLKVLLELSGLAWSDINRVLKYFVTQHGTCVTLSVISDSEGNPIPDMSFLMNNGVTL